MPKNINRLAGFAFLFTGVTFSTMGVLRGDLMLGAVALSSFGVAINLFYRGRTSREDEASVERSDQY